MMKYFCLLSLLFLCACTAEELDRPGLTDLEIEFRDGNRMEAFYLSSQVDYFGDVIGFCGEDPLGHPIFQVENQTFTGTSNFLGEISGKVDFCATAFDLYDPNSIPAELNGMVTLLDLNGDSIYFEIMVLLFPDPKENIYSVMKGRYSIIGGSGQFASATGKGKIRGSASSLNDPEVPILVNYEGKIAY